ncbi:Quinonprotein alcohol dehydrogenase-like superfamily domain-containing protein [Rozella allomycis CSF55]|uniref:Quinonprotein alcohol dehydrogenase-like superfamily domain-containing protein n=1 Tax=Rozella allomycis (strain CSF55) TaxID=988480 RepID=A0A075B4R8_ROZAC|nr:Quinonprotein alcohol dehydrogenase-like superfamily domain-containing protein [Rozella allomycis CSF55]|eukprot:EPZ36569.1 Quinonprotein alcohol dehydrogenase-like superfamily domain-containing protein [Rozella allomycis CSF55]
MTEDALYSSESVISLLKQLSIKSDNQWLEKKGNVTQIMDRTIGKPVFRIKGKHSVHNNYTILPSETLTRLSHKRGHLYLQWKPVDNLDLSMEVAMQVEGGMSFRINISTNEHTKANILIEISKKGHWSILYLNLNDLAMRFTRRGYRGLKEIKIGSSIVFRDAILSQNALKRMTFPRDVKYPNFKDGQWDDWYDWYSLNEANVFTKSWKEYNVATKGVNEQRLGVEYPVIENASISNNEIISKNEGSENNLMNYSCGVELNKVLGCVNCELFRVNEGSDEYIIIGHSGEIVDVCVTDDFIFSVQTKPSLLRVWDVKSKECLNVFSCVENPLGIIASVDQSMIIVRGRESQNRTSFVVYNVVKDGRGVRLEKKLNFYGDVVVYKFYASKFKSNTFYTVGNLGIKCWTIGDSRLKSFSFKLPSTSEIKKIEFIKQNGIYLIVVGTELGQLYLMNHDNGELVETIEMYSPIIDILIEKETILVSTRDKKLSIIRNNELYYSKRLDLTGEECPCKLFKTNQGILVLFQSGSMICYSKETLDKKKIQSWSQSNSTLKYFSLSKNNGAFLCYENGVISHLLKNGNQRRWKSENGFESVSSLAASSKYIIFGYQNGIIKLFDFNSKYISEQKPHNSRVTRILISDDEKSFMTFGETKLIKMGLKSVALLKKIGEVSTLGSVILHGYEGVEDYFILRDFESDEIGKIKIDARNVLKIFYSKYYKSAIFVYRNGLILFVDRESFKVTRKINIFKSDETIKHFTFNENKIFYILNEYPNELNISIISDKLTLPQRILIPNSNILDLSIIKNNLYIFYTSGVILEYSILNLTRKDPQIELPQQIALPEPEIEFNEIETSEIKELTTQDAFLVPSEDCCVSIVKVLSSQSTIQTPFHWNKSNNQIIYSCGNLIVAEEIATQNQKIYREASNYVNKISSFCCNMEYIAAVESRNRGSIIRLWNLETAICERILTCNSDYIKFIKFVPNNPFILVVSNQMNLINYNSGVIHSTVDLDEEIKNFEFDPNCDNEFVVCCKNKLLFWRIYNEKLTFMRESILPCDWTECEFTNIKFKQDSSNLLITTTNNGLVGLWDSRKGQCILSWSVDNIAINSLYVIDRKIFTGNLNGSLRCWKIAEWVEKHEQNFIENEVSLIFEKNFNLSIELIDFNDNNDGFVCLSDGSIWQASEKDGNEIVEFISSFQNLVDITSNDSIVASIHENGKLCLRTKIDDEWHCKTLNIEDLKNCSSISLSNETLVAVGFSDGSIKVFDIETEKKISEFQPSKSKITNIKFYSRFVSLSNVHTGATLNVLKEHKGSEINCINIKDHPFKENCSFMLVCCSDHRSSLWEMNWTSNDYLLVDWITFNNLNTGNLIGAFIGHDSIVLTSSNAVIQMYSIPERKVFRTLKLPRVLNSLEISPCMNFAIGACNNSPFITAIDLESGAFHDILAHSEEAKFIGFSLVQETKSLNGNFNKLDRKIEKNIKNKMKR